MYSEAQTEPYYRVTRTPDVWPDAATWHADGTEDDLADDEPEVAYCHNCGCNRTFAYDENEDNGYYICGMCGCLGGPSDIGDEPMLLSWCLVCDKERLFGCIDGYAVGVCEFCFTEIDARPK